MRALVKNTVLFCIVLLLCFLLLEVGLRSVLPAPVVWTYPQESYQYDSQIGHWLESNQSAYTHDKIVNTNSDGLRDHEYEKHAPINTIRILALGDSQTFGNGLLLEETWPKQLENALNNSGLDTKYEVLNAGLPGSDTWQHEIILERMLARYNPDMVILAFYINDVVKKFTPSPVTKIQRDPNISKLVYFLKKSVLLLNIRIALGVVKNMISPSSGYLLEQATLRGEDTPALKERWKQVSDSIASMKRLLDATKAEFLIFSLPRRDQVAGQVTWDAYHSKLATITKQNEIALYSMLEPLQVAYKVHGKQLFIPWDGHNTNIANRVISETLKVAIVDLTDL